MQAKHSDSKPSQMTILQCIMGQLCMLFGAFAMFPLSKQLIVLIITASADSRQILEPETISSHFDVRVEVPRSYFFHLVLYSYD